MTRVLLLFIDGLGLGENQAHNPLYALPTPGLNSLLGGAPLTLKSIGASGEKSLLLPLDAGLNVPGVPQSATGQASLFTGENAAALLGRHLKGFPNETLRNLLREKGFFQECLAQGFKVTFANAFRPAFFSALEKGHRFFSCSTMLNYYAGLPFRSLEDVEEGEAVYADITNEYLQEQGFPVTVIEPAEAAHRLCRLATGYDLTLFEYFLTDIAAHSRKAERIHAAIHRLDEFLLTLDTILPPDCLLVVTSDHGNIEDTRMKGHTQNPVPALIYGRERDYFAGKLACITDVAPTLREFLAAHLVKSTWRAQAHRGGAVRDV